MTFIYGRRAALRLAIAIVTGGIAAVALAAPSSADSWNEQITVDPCKKPWTQLCKNIQSWDTHYSTPSNVWITADPTHCSDIIAHVRIDGRVVGSDLLGPGESTAEYRVPPGEHTVGVQAEGVTGGCNRGFLSAWGGTVHFQKLGPEQIIDGPNGE